MGQGYSPVCFIISPMAFAIAILLSSTFSKTSLYFSSPLLLVALFIAIFYVCIICPLKERNTEDFSYKKCVKRSLFYLAYKRNLLQKVTMPLFIIAFLGIPLQIMLFIIISDVIILLLIFAVIAIWEFFHPE